MENRPTSIDAPRETASDAGEDLRVLLRDASAEIKQLRRRNEILAAKVEVMNLFSVVLHTAPAYPPQGMSVDVAWQLDEQLRKLGGLPVKR